MRALISVYDKHGIDTFASGLAQLGFELVSSGGTATFLEEQGLEVTRVEDVTGAPEMLGGRVKTLHPAIHAGILARLDLDEDRSTLAEHEIEPFDLVCVNLYPFTSLAGRFGVDEGLDTGPILVQEPVPVEPRETLEDRIHAVEHRLLPATVADLVA